MSLNHGLPPQFSKIWTNLSASSMSTPSAKNYRLQKRRQFYMDIGPLSIGEFIYPTTPPNVSEKSLFYFKVWRTFKPWLQPESIPFEFQLVRSPLVVFTVLGYWSFLLAPGDPYIQGFEQYLDQAIIWAQQTGLKVWIDLHGVPGGFKLSGELTLYIGSQNGFDNSGRRGAINWGTGQTINYSQQALKIIVNKYSAAPYAGTVVAIEIVNEPNGDYLSQSLIKNFYTYGISIIRSENNNMLFVMQDAFLPLDTWASVPSSSDIGNGVIDTHHYEGITLFSLRVTLLQFLALISICGIKYQMFVVLDRI